MTLAELKSVVAAYHHKSLSDLTVGGLDLFLIAANNARRNAELKHNFEFCRVAATLDITGASGGSLLNATITEGSATARMREIVNVSRLNTIGDRRIPLDFTRADIAVERQRSEEEIWDYYTGWSHYERYYRTPSDADILNRQGRSSVVQRGHQIFVYPIPITDVDNTPLTLYLEGFGELADYTAADLLTNSPLTTPVVITGTLNPDSAGSYLYKGTFNNYSFFWRSPDNLYVLFANDAGTYILQDIAGGMFQQPDGWENSAVGTLPPLTMSPQGAATGSAALAYSTPANTTDFLLTYGGSYMMWQCIIELNYLFTTFVPRQEGNLSAPEKARDQAWNDLLTWDAYMVDSNVTRSR